MRQILEIIRTRELRIVVVAVVLGQAVANALSHVINLLTNSVNLLIRATDMPGYASAVKAAILMALMSVVLWTVVAGGALLIIQRLLREPEER